MQGNICQNHPCRNHPFCEPPTLRWAKSLGRLSAERIFSRIFIFEPPNFFADFLAGFFLLTFVGKSAQKNPPGKSPGKSSKIHTTKILQHISADWPGQEIARSKSRIASDLKTRDSNRWRPCDLKLRFETRDWRFGLNTPIQQNCEKGCDLSPRSKIASDWRLAILPI